MSSNFYAQDSALFNQHFCPPFRFRNQFLPTVPTFAVRETDVSWHNGGSSGAPLKPHNPRLNPGQQMLERWAKIV